MRLTPSPYLRLVGVLLGVSVSFPALAATYYVAPAPTGSDTNPGTEAQPFATVGRGQMAAAAGDTVYIRGGMYTFSGTTATVGVNFNKSGQQDRRINYWAFPGEVPIFDLFNLLPNARVTGLNVQASWIHIKGLEVRGVQQVITGDSWGVRIQGSNNILENLNVHHNEAPGVFITSGANNLILNCDSHHNYDPLEGGGNGDGFGCHSSGGGNVISACRGYSNSDDGFDFINASGTCTVEKSWSFRNGYQPDTMTAAGNGAGFKSGGYGLDPTTFPATIPRHTVRQCVAFRNRSQGVYANHHPGGIDFFNNTSYGNGSNFDMTADVGASSHKLRNNIALTPGGTIRNLTGGTDTTNSWSLSGITVSTADFMNVTEDEALMPRQADGSLPNIGFLHLVPGSDLIDKGEDVGLPFAGTAPDLGAFEVGLATTTGAGGAGGAGGSVGTGAGGASGAGGRGGAGGTGAGGSGAGGTGAGGTSAAGSGGTSGTGAGGTSAAGTGGTSGVGNGGTSGAGTGGTVGGVAGSTGGDGVTNSCGCHLPAGRGGLSVVLLAAAMILVRRRRARAR